jgi:glucose-6-phosphate 1-dehydrogenase
VTRSATQTPWTRIIAEKPFGTDRDSARRLTNQFHEVVNEDQVYRIDHYLGKDAVQDVSVLRFANSLFEPLWNRNHIDQVQVTVAETLGVGNRGGYFNAMGQTRDMVQSHALQVISLLAMEPPNSFAANAVRQEKAKVLDRDAPAQQLSRRARTVRSRSRPGWRTRSRLCTGIERSDRLLHGNIHGGETQASSRGAGRAYRSISARGSGYPNS